ECAYTGTDGGATHPADTDADRMGAGRMGNGVAIHIVGIFHGVLVLGSAWVWERPFRGTLPGIPVIAPADQAALVSRLLRLPVSPDPGVCCAAVPGNRRQVIPPPHLIGTLPAHDPGCWARDRGEGGRA